MLNLWLRKRAKIEPPVQLALPDGICRLLFVCMGNICRSPTAEAVMRHMVQARGLQDRVLVDSCGTHDYHVGHPPDLRAQIMAQRRGYDLSRLRARRIELDDFDNFDLLLAMDYNNRGLLLSMAAPEQRGKVRLLMDFAARFKSPVVPDPYTGGPRDFEKALDYIEDACEGLVKVLAETSAVAQPQS